MTKQEMITFINDLPEDANGRIYFITQEILEDTYENTRQVFTSKAQMLARLNSSFDDNLRGSFRDGRMTVITACELMPE